MTFNDGDRVIHKTRLDRGTVVDSDGGTIYIELDNGVEMDFSALDLMLEEDYKTPHEVEQGAINAVAKDKKKAAEEIWPKIRPILASMTHLYADNASMAVVALGGAAGSWDEMTTYHKMNFLCVWTKTSFDDWINSAEIGKLDDLQLLILTQIGLEVSK